MGNAKGHIVGAVIVGSLGLAALSLAAWGLTQAASDRDWQEIDAEVTSVAPEPYTYTGKRSGGGTYTAQGIRLEVSYAYKVDGRLYESSRYSLLSPSQEFTNTEREDARRRQKELSSGKVDAWYDPDDPSSAVLARSPVAQPVAVGIVSLVLLFVAAFQVRAARQAS